jgi:hypothetical protein
LKIYSKLNACDIFKNVKTKWYNKNIILIRLVFCRNAFLQKIPYTENYGCYKIPTLWNEYFEHLKTAFRVNKNANKYYYDVTRCNIITDVKRN